MDGDSPVGGEVRPVIMWTTSHGRVPHLHDIHAHYMWYDEEAARDNGDCCAGSVFKVTLQPTLIECADMAKAAEEGWMSTAGDDKGIDIEEDRSTTLITVHTMDGESYVARVISWLIEGDLLILHRTGSSPRRVNFPMRNVARFDLDPGGE